MSEPIGARNTCGFTACWCLKQDCIKSPGSIRKLFNTSITHASYDATGSLRPPIRPTKPQWLAPAPAQMQRTPLTERHMNTI